MLARSILSRAARCGPTSANAFRNGDLATGGMWTSIRTNKSSTTFTVSAAASSVRPPPRQDGTDGTARSGIELSISMLIEQEELTDIPSTTTDTNGVQSATGWVKLAGGCVALAGSCVALEQRWIEMEPVKGDD